MPLYKLTSKKLEKKQKQDESGLTELKEILGVNDDGSGSDESGSSSSSESESEGEEEDGEPSEASGSGSGSEEEDEVTEKARGKRKRTTTEDDDSDEDEEDEDDDDGSEEESDVEDDDEHFSISLEEAPDYPLYAFPTPDCPDAQACIFCPGKVLKNERMEAIHLKSGSHERSLKRYRHRLSTHQSGAFLLSTADPRKVVASLLDEAALKSSSGVSKRDSRKTPLSKESQLRSEKRAAAKIKRQERKVVKKAKREEKKERRKARVASKVNGGALAKAALAPPAIAA